MRHTGRATRLNWIAAFFVMTAPNFVFGQAENPKMPPGFSAEMIYKVPNEQGSWVSITHDPLGRLITSDQYGKLYRITPPAANRDLKIEPIECKIGRAQGLLCAFDSLYVVAHAGDEMPAGLFRLKDTDANDQYDQVELLRKFDGGSEHGPHAVILSPDKTSLFICAGNHTAIPNPETSRVPRIWEEDQVLPRLPDANGHAAGRMAPGGWVCKTDPEGKSFELVSIGYRNQYDIAFDPNGELFTYDADMEWDVGLPWYRPTRVCHVTSGSEFGWRNGTGKWPEYYPDSLPAVVDIGPGSPTGIVFGTGARFPHKYQNSLFISDWSYGIIYAVTLEPDGASYTGTQEIFCTAPALPVTDLIINPTDGAMYFLVGGRRSQSALYRVTYKGDEATTPAKYAELTPDVITRRKIESLHLKTGESVVDDAWPFLKHSDRFLRFAARTAIENSAKRQPADSFSWLSKASESNDPQTLLEIALALTRTGAKDADASSEYATAAIKALDKLKWNELSKFQKLSAIRTWGLVYTRYSNPTETLIKSIHALAPHYPTNDPELDRELSRILIVTEAPEAVAKTVELMIAAGPQHQQVHYALALSAAKTGWTSELREGYFGWFAESGRLQGGNSFGGYLKNILGQAVEKLTTEEQEKFKTILAKTPETKDPYAEINARPEVKKWTLEDFQSLDETDFTNRDLTNGQKMFAIAACYKCHRLKGLGGIVGPDLTPAGHRFTTRDLLETILDPNKEISDQYQATVFQMEDGRTLAGRVVNLARGNYMVQTDMARPNQMANLKVEEIEAMKPSAVSLMPSGLINNLTRDEVLDLLAYMKSTAPKDIIRNK